MVRAYVSIGSNIDRETNIRNSITALRNQFGELVLSHVYESRAIGFAGENFFNLVCRFDTTLSVEQVLSALREIEQSQGRKRSGTPYEARTLDLDLLLYDDLIRHDRIVDLPRAEILKYAFVLGPLAEIAPHQTHPENRQNFADLWRRFKRQPADLQEIAFNFP